MKRAKEVEAIKAFLTRQVDRCRHGEEFEDELADIIIRVADLAGYLEIDLGRAVHRKMRRNRERPMKHGKVC